MSDSVPEVAKVEEPVTNAVAVEAPATDAAPEKTEAEPVKAAAEEAPANGTDKSEGEAKNSSPKKEGRFQRNGQDRGPRVFKKYESKSKFDPSKLPITDNHSEIRAQVCIVVRFIYF